MTKEEYAKKKQELEAYVVSFAAAGLAVYVLLSLYVSEYLATFKKTVAMHEVFLQRIASHPILYLDHNFQTFLEYDQDVS